MERITRKDFLKLVFGSILGLTAFRYRFGWKNKKRKSSSKNIIRPPASLPEEEFVQRCIRCGNCMKVCVTNVLQPCFLEAGIQSIWTPKFNTSIGYCEYNCNLCGQVCPTGAIRNISIEEKKNTKMGYAQVDKSICLAWAYGKECLVCEEHCPINEKAIKVSIKRINGKIVRVPYVDFDLCVGCAICENKCPVKPGKAIRVVAF